MVQIKNDQCNHGYPNNLLQKKEIEESNKRKELKS